MKTLRVVRNIAVLFMLGMSLLSLRPEVGVVHAAGGKSCGYKKDFICAIGPNGGCVEFHCSKGNPLCNNTGCV